jgi:hypothetical protein
MNEVKSERESCLALQQPNREQMIPDHGFKALAWKTFDAKIRQSLPAPDSEAKAFFAKGIHFGRIKTDFANSLNEIIGKATVDPLRRDDYTPGFVTAKFDSETIRTMNKTSQFRVFSVREKWALGELLDFLKDEVAACLGSPWSTLNVMAWTTRARTDNFGMYDWHSDGFVPEIFKIMVYLVPLTPETGGFEFLGEDERVIRYESAEPGAWVLFKNTEILHRGIPGTVNVRNAIEITLCRSGSFDIRPRFPGQNSHWPEYPWIGALDGCSETMAQIIARRSFPRSALK